MSARVPRMVSWLLFQPLSTASSFASPSSSFSRYVQIALSTDTCRQIFFARCCYLGSHVTLYSVSTRVKNNWRLDTLEQWCIHKLSMGMYTNSVWVCTQTQCGYVHKQYEVCTQWGMYTNSVWVCTQTAVWVCTQTQYMGMYTNSVWVCTQLSMGMYTNLCTRGMYTLSMGMYTNSVWVCTQTQYGFVHKLSMGMVWVFSMGCSTPQYGYVHKLQRCHKNTHSANCNKLKFGQWYVHKQVCTHQFVIEGAAMTGLRNSQTRTPLAV